MPEAPAIDPVRRRAAVVATAVAIPVAVLLVLLLNRGALRGGAAPTAAPTGSAAIVLPAVPVPAPPGSTAAARACPGLIAALPVRLGELAGRPVQSPSAAVLAWGEPPVVLRCGVPRPAAFVAGAPDVVAVNGVTWFVQPRGERTVWTVVDRTVYIEAIVPSGYASAPIPPLSDAVTAALRAAPLRPGH
jgi:hypothetical protein